MKAPKPLLIVVTVAILGLAGIAFGALGIGEHLGKAEAARIEPNLVSNLQHLLGKPKRAYLVTIDPDPFSKPERPAPFSVNPRLESVLFLL